MNGIRGEQKLAKSRGKCKVTSSSAGLVHMSDLYKLELSGKKELN